MSSSLAWGFSHDSQIDLHLRKIKSVNSAKGSMGEILAAPQSSYTLGVSSILLASYKHMQRDGTCVRPCSVVRLHPDRRDINWLWSYITSLESGPVG
ncbi:hypothetical protein VNO77_27075 [Canavalia gladiata]|uniref:Uncharacterized protein n=1 Tax=Canavalia gladiata TaxID=3824 RepID=A0AAN9KUQ5_CANGL